MSSLPRWVLVVGGLSITLNLVGLGWFLGRATQTTSHVFTAHGDFATPVSEFLPEQIATEGFVIQQGHGGGHHVFTFTDEHGTTTTRTVPMVAAEIPEDIALGLEWIVETLPPERRETITGELAVQEQPLLENAEAVVVSREAVRAALEGRAFEKQRLEQALAQLREQMVTVQARSHAILADVAEDLTPEEREALASRLATRVAERIRIAPEAPLPPSVSISLRRSPGAPPEVRVYSTPEEEEHPPAPRPDPPDPP